MARNTPVTPGLMKFPRGSDITPAGGATQEITIPLAAAAIETLCSGGDFPYLTRPDGGQTFPTAFAIVMQSGTTDLCRIRFDGDPTATLGKLIPVEPNDWLPTDLDGTAIPRGRFKVIAAGGAPVANILFIWDV